MPNENDNDNDTASASARDNDVRILINGREWPVDSAAIDELAKLRVKRTYNGAEIANAVGDVNIEINGKPYVVRMGTREWLAAEDAFKVKGIPAITKLINTHEKSLAEFYRIALSRYHGGMKVNEIYELMDWRGEAGAPTLKDALERALSYSRPAFFKDEDVDPKAQAAIQAAFLAMRDTAKATPEASTANTQA